MPRNEDSFELDEETPSDYVPAVFARSMEEAEHYRELLDDHDIPAIIGQEDEDEQAPGKRRARFISRGVPVLVPEALLDEASEVIADSQDLDEFEAEEEEIEEDEEEEFELEEDEDLEADEEEDEDEQEYLEDEEEDFDEEDLDDEDEAEEEED